MNEVAIAMRTRRIRLRAFLESDMPQLFAWRNTDSFRSYIMPHDRKVDFDQFCQDFADGSPYRAFDFLIETVRDGTPAGFAFVHGMSERESHAFVMVYLEERFEGRGYGVDAFLLLARFMFETIGLRSLYVEVAEYNKLSLASIRAAGLKEVERLKGQRVHNGLAYDRLRFRGDAERLPEVVAWLDKLSAPKRPRAIRGSNPVCA